MNKLGILVIAIAASFVIGVFSQNALGQGFGDEFILWTEDQKLTWDDYLGTPDKYPKSFDLSDRKVRAFTWGDMKIDSHFEKAPSIICQYQIIKVNAIGRFDKKQSWVKEEVLDSPDVLKHEQGHFDIMEVFARKTQSTLLLKIFECPNGVYDEQLIKNEIQKLVLDFGNEGQKIHVKYDDETNTGHDLNRQNSWERQIDSDLMKYHKTITDYSANETRPNRITEVGTEKIACQIGWKAIQKHSTGKLACVTPAVSLVLEERGWGSVIE